MRNKKRFTILNLILVVLLSIGLMYSQPTVRVYADETVDNYEPTEEELKAWSDTQKLPTDSGAIAEIKKNYKNAIPNIATNNNITVEEYTELQIEKKCKFIKKFKEEISTKGALDATTLCEKVAPVLLNQATDNCVDASIAMAAQNCGLLDAEHQLSKGLHNDTEVVGWVAYNAPAYVSAYGDGTLVGAGDSLAGAFGADNSTTGNGCGTAIVGTTSKRFINMTEAEFAECCKAIWNGGYFACVAVRYKIHGEEALGDYGGDVFPDDSVDDEADANDFIVNHFRSAGSAGYYPNSITGRYKDNTVTVSSTHFTYLIGVADDGKVYLADPCGPEGTTEGRYRTIDENGWNGIYQPVGMVVWKSENSSPMKLANGSVLPANLDAGTAAGIIDKDEPEKNTFTIGSQTYYSENDLSSFAKLDEVNIQSVYLSIADASNLTQNERVALKQWHDQVDFVEEKPILKFFRTLIVLIGILLTVWALLIYLGFWLDRINNFIDIQLLPILTLNKLRASDSDDDCSYGNKDKADKASRTANHRAIIKVCVVMLFTGALMITGYVYKMLFWVVNWIIGVIK